MSEQKRPFFDFDEYRLDPVKRQLLKNGEAVALTPKAFDTLFALVEQSGQVLSKDYLINRIWPDTFVEEGNLAVNISALRKALGESPDQHRYIVTVPGRGYRFVANVREVWDKGPDLIVQEHTLKRIVIEQEEIQSEKEAIEVERKAWLVSIASTLSRLSLRKLNWATTAISAFAALLIAAGIYLLVEKHPPKADASPIRTIAVLPFKSLSANSADEYLGIGMTETLITRLNGLGQISVRQISAVHKYINLGVDPVTAGQEMNVDTILDGSVQKIGDKIRVIVSLVRVEDGSSIWSDSFDGDFASIFSVQDTISRRVALALPLKLTRKEEQLIAKRPTKNSEAYQLYMRGRYFWNKRTTEDLFKSAEQFKKAIEQDKDYALAYAGLADSYVLLGSSGSYNVASPVEMMPKAREAAQKALELDDGLAEAHVSLGMVSFLYDWDWEGAEKEFKRAIELNPEYAVARYWRSFYLFAMGRVEEAISESQRAQEADPVSLAISLNLGRAFHFARRYDDAISQYQKTLNMDQNFLSARFLLGLAYDQKGMQKEAVSEMQKVAATSADKVWSVTASAYASAISGNTAGALGGIEKLKELAAQAYVPPANFAMIYARLGDKDETFKWYDKAYEERSSVLLYLKYDPTSEQLRSDARFPNLLRRIGL
jgi:DNA-binding winged helix-turn-helix (wHTH) protein/TolB-like protein/Flp pilus assembly protein TadD